MKECVVEVLWRSVVETCCSRGVLQRSHWEKFCKEALERSLVGKCCREVLERNVVETC